ncbi:hypothetical protein ES703_21371 [subsurface metagenome]
MICSMAVTGKKPAKAERQFAKLARQTCGGLALHSGNTIKGQPSHKDAPYVFLGTNDPKVARRGERADVAPTILARFGLKLAGFKPFDYSKAGVYGDPAWIKKAKNVTFPPLELPPKP